MGLPLALCQLHMRKHCPEGGVLRRTGIDAEPDLFLAFVHMADAHLPEMDPVLRALYTVIIFSAAETIPHGLHISAYDLSLIHI